MTNMNSMLPTYQGNYKDMIGALKYGDITNPCWFWIEDRKNLAFIHWEKDSEGNKKLVPHAILWEQMVDVQAKLEGLVDEEGKAVKVTKYVQETVAPVESKVDEVNKRLTMITELEDE